MENSDLTERERRSYAELYEEVKEKYQTIGRELEDHSFLLDLPFSTSTPEGVWKRELQKLREVTENRSSASQPLEGQNVREPEGSLMSSKGKRTRSPGSTSGEKDRKR